MSRFEPTHPDEADAARLDAVMAAHYDTYGEDGPTAADVLDDEEIAHAEAARPPADEARRNSLSMAAVLLAAADVPDDENPALAELAALDEVAGPPAPVVDELWRGHTPRPRTLSMLVAGAESGRVALGWDAGWTPHRDDTLVWDHTRSHLAVHTPRSDRLEEGDHLALAVAVQLVRRYGPGAVTLVDATPDRSADEARRWWAPFVDADAGVDVHPLVADPGRAVGAMAGVAAAALARTTPTGNEAPRYLVVLHAHLVVPALEAAGAHHYAAAARDTLRIIGADGVRRRVHLVTSHLGDLHRTRDVQASVWAPDTGAWSYMAHYTDVPAEVLAGPPSPQVVLPAPASPDWWAAHITG